MHEEQPTIVRGGFRWALVEYAHRGGRGLFLERKDKADTWLDLGEETAGLLRLSESYTVLEFSIEYRVTQ